jgi:signal transduction histidine kinase
MGLRPSMLDDFGLQPALEWLVRDFSRRSHVHVDSNIAGNLGSLTDRHRTCVFRTVQEALTNCARHSGASSVVVDVTGSNQEVTVAVRDDGIGLMSENRRSGLGLRGLEERARELNGTLTIDSGGGTGTTLRLWLPLPATEGGR